jgi:diguanylate cyclase (GGDEF)-like protein
LRYQLGALASISRVLTESEDLESVLEAIAETTASVTGFDYVSLDLLGPNGLVLLRSTNLTRREMATMKERWRQNAARPDPVLETVARTGKPLLFSDAQNDERIPESGRRFLERMMVRSSAVLPMLAKDVVIGTFSVASFHPREFTEAEVELLEGFAVQAATAVQAIQLYRELAESREQLQGLNQELQSRMGIEYHLARTDALTGIPNRRFIDETVQAEVARARRYGQRLSLVVADVDHLKEVNDLYSHQAGDETLRFIAGVARESCREVDVVGRYGGDEFVFVLPSTTLEDAVSVAERFRIKLAERPSAARTGHPLRLGVSQGVAEWDSDSMHDATALVLAADRAMYEAKAGGRNQTIAAPRRKQSNVA